MTDQPQIPDEGARPEVADEGAGADPQVAPESYEAASERLEEIIKQLDSGTAGLRETLELVKEARALVDYCAGELEAVGRGLDELRLDDLVARLESGTRAQGGGQAAG